MNATRLDVFAAISREREYQDAKWGAPHLPVTAWLLILEEELAEAKRDWVKSEKDEAALREILQVVAVGVAALEQHGVFERGQP